MNASNIDKIMKGPPEVFPKPDLLISFNEINPELRQYFSLSYPFTPSEDPKWQGCYLFYSEVVEWDLTKNVFDPDAFIRNDRILPLYVGRSCVLPVRIRQHCTWRTKWINQYIGSDLTIRGNDRLYELDWPYAYIWLTQGGEERKALEHLLIGTIKPVYNKS